MSGRRIGIVCPYSLDHHGGVQNHVLWLARHLSAGGDAVSLLAPGDHPSVPPGVELISTGPAFPVPYNGSVARVNFGPITAARVRAWLRRGRFDLVHVHEPITPSIALLALAAAEVPVVATFHTATPRSRTMAVAGRVLDGLVRKIDAGVAVSESARQVVVQHLGRDAVVVPNGFDAEPLLAAAAAPGRGPWRGGSAPRITFLGRTDEPRKGLDVLLAGVPALRAARPDVDIVVAGRGRRALPVGVRAVGPVTDSEKSELLAGTDVFVAPHLARESFGIVLLEALAAGAAVVASALPAFVDLLEPLGGDTRIVPVGDPVGLVDGILAMVRRDRFDAPPAALARFGWDAVGPQLAVAYRAALASGPHRSGVAAVGRTTHRARRSWPELDAALRRRASVARAIGIEPGPPPSSTMSELRPEERERAESELSEALRASGHGVGPEQHLLGLVRRFHNDAVATARRAGGRARLDDLRSFEMAEG